MKSLAFARLRLHWGAWYQDILSSEMMLPSTYKERVLCLGLEGPGWVGDTQRPWGLAAVLGLLVELGLPQPLDKSESLGDGWEGARSLLTCLSALPLCQPSLCTVARPYPGTCRAQTRVTMKPTVY